MNKRYEDIPDDYLKTSILKFLCLDFKIHDLIPQILKKTQILIDKNIENVKEDAKSSQNFIELHENVDYQESCLSILSEKGIKRKESALDELAKTNASNEDSSFNNNKTEGNEKSYNFFKKIFTKSNKNDNAKNLESFSEILKEKRKPNDKLNLHNISICLKNINQSNTLSINQNFLKNFEKENNNLKNQVEIFSLNI